MIQNYDIKLEIKTKLKKQLIFGLDARLPIALIIGFMGYRHEVVPLMQTISHSTRAYLVNANGLRGFVDDLDIMKVLKKADSKKQLDRQRKW